MEVINQMKAREVALLAERARIDEQLVAVRNALQGVELVAAVQEEINKAAAAKAADAEPKAE